MSILETVSGVVLDLDTSLHESGILIEDIAHALSMQCRFNGQVKRFYSVAEHSYFAALAADHADASSIEVLHVLMHDAHEAYIGDVVSPIKDLLGYDYASLEDRFNAVIERRFDLVFPAHAAIIRRCDLAMLRKERRELLNASGVNWRLPPEDKDATRAVEGAFSDYDDEKLPCWDPTTAKDNFLGLFADLQRQLNRY